MSSKFQHLKGLMTVSDNYKRQSCGNQSTRCRPLQFQLCCQNGEFWNINGTLYSTQRGVPTNFIALRSRLVLVLLFYHRLESGSGATFAKLPFSSSYANYFSDRQIKGHFKNIISQPTFHRMQPLNLESINQS